MLVGRLFVLAILMAMSFADWKRTQAKDEIIRSKDSIIELLEQRHFEVATRDTIREASAPGAAGSFYIHAPETGCPQGWNRLDDLFTEKDGTKRAGCLWEASRSGEFHMDYLAGGESASPTLVIPIPVEQPHKPEAE